MKQKSNIELSDPEKKKQFDHIIKNRKELSYLMDHARDDEDFSIFKDKNTCQIDNVK